MADMADDPSTAQSGERRNSSGGHQTGSRSGGCQVYIMPVMGGASPSGQGLRRVREPAGGQEAEVWKSVPLRDTTTVQEGYGTGAHSVSGMSLERCAHLSSMATNCRLPFSSR